MKGKKQSLKVIPHCYRRNLSRTLSNSSISQLVQIGSYKKRINDLSRNNRHLASALQEARIEAAIQNNILKDCAKDCNKVLFARLKLNDMAKNLAKFVGDLEEVRSCLDVGLLSDNNPFAPKKGSPSDRLCKEPAVNCIEEVSEESSEVIATENVPTVPDLTPSHNAGDKISDVVPSTSNNNGDFVNEENMEMPPILFAEDSDEKKKKSSSKRKISKASYDPDKGSLTPELNIELTCVKLKRKSSRRHSQFIFPGSRSTSRGKTTSIGKENSEELVTPTLPSFNCQERVATEINQTTEIFKSPINNNQSLKEKESENPSSLPESYLPTVLDAPQSDFSNVSTINTVKSLKTTVAPEAQSGESNHTVLFCVDMELTEVIRPAQQIIVENGLPFVVKSLDNAALDCGITKESKENDALCFYDEAKNSACNKETPTTKKDSLELLNTHLTTPKLPDDDDIQLPEINEDDEVQNVGMITFCEPNDNDGSIAGRTTKSSFIRHSRHTKPKTFALFFSSDESDADSSFEILTTKPKASKRNTVISIKTDRTCEKTEDTANHPKVALELENEVIKNDLLKCTVDALALGKDEKHIEKKPSKKSRDMKVSSKNDLLKQSSQKCSATSESEKFKVKKRENVKKLVPSHEKVKKSKLSPENVKKSGLSPKIVKKSRLSHENVKKSGINHENIKKSGINHENIKKLIFSPISSSSILKKSEFNSQSTKELGNKTPLKKFVQDNNLDDSIINDIETPKSESRKVSFAPTDLVCNFKRMSVSKKISENKKVRRTSKSVIDFEELLQQEALTKTSHIDSDNSSESTNIQKLFVPDFSGDTELYTFSLPKDTTSLPVPTIDDLMHKFTTSSNASQKNTNKNSRHSKKILPGSKPVEITRKLSLKKSKDPKNTEPQLVSGKMCKERDILMFESPVSISKSAKRKSLFKEDLLDDSKENIFNHPILEKPKTQEKIKPDINMNSELSAQKNYSKPSSSTKSQNKVQRKISTKKLSDKQKLFQPTPEVKRKKHSVALKSLENSPVLKDTINLPETQSSTSRRRSKQISYKEPNLHKKLRRE